MIVGIFEDFVYVLLSEIWLPKDICRKIACSPCRNFAGTLENCNLLELCLRLIKSSSRQENHSNDRGSFLVCPLIIITANSLRLFSLHPIPSWSPRSWTRCTPASGCCRRSRRGWRSRRARRSRRRGTRETREGLEKEQVESGGDSAKIIQLWFLFHWLC